MADREFDSQRSQRIRECAVESSARRGRPGSGTQGYMPAIHGLKAG